MQDMIIIFLPCDEVIWNLWFIEFHPSVERVCGKGNFISKKCEHKFRTYVSIVHDQKIGRTACLLTRAVVFGYLKKRLSSLQIRSVFG